MPVSSFIHGAYNFFDRTRRNFNFYTSKTQKNFKNLWSNSFRKKKTAQEMDEDKQFLIQRSHSSFNAIKDFLKPKNGSKPTVDPENRCSLEAFFLNQPKTVILTVTAHGMLEEPKRVPLLVKRNMAVDFESANLLQEKRKTEIILAAELGKEHALVAFVGHRPNIEDKHVSPEDAELLARFKQDEHYLNEVVFKKGEFMFDKSFEVRNQKLDKIILTDPSTKKTTNIVENGIELYYLSNILKTLNDNKVEEVTLFDFSCNNGYTPFPLFWRQNHYYRSYGGKRSRNRRYRKRKTTR